MPGLLDGVRVIDMTSVLMGPFATQILGDYGAEVIKVEGPSGDTTRKVPPMRHDNMGSTYLHLNRNKRSLVLDLKQPAALDAMLKLIATVDVFVSNVRPAALARLGLTPERLEAANPRLIVASLVGFGQDGPYAADPAYEDLIQGLTCVPSLVVAAGAHEPHYVPVSYNDRAVGLSAATAILAALLERERSGKGQSIEVPMFETMTQMVMGDHFCGLTFDPPEGPPGYQRTLNPERRPYPTKDGYVCVIIYTDRHWQSFADLIGRSKLLEEDERFTTITARTTHAQATYALIAEKMPERTTAEWLEALNGADIPATPLHTLDTIMDDPHLKAVNFFRRIEHPSEGAIYDMAVPAKFSRSETPVRRYAAGFGEHSREVLAEAGLDEAAIDDLIASQGAIAAHQ